MPPKKRPPKEMLEELYLQQQLPMLEIAKRLNVYYSTIDRWLRRYQIPKRPYQTPDVWNSRKDEIVYLYHICNLSQDQIAEYYGTQQNQIYRVMKRLAIPRKSKGRAGAAHHQFKDGQSSVLYRKLIVKNQCSHCGTTEKLGIHHKNNDHYDNRIENLEVLCNPCHMSETKKAWWAAKKAGKAYKGNARIGWTKK